MQQSIQRDLPNARVNITLDLETGNGQEKKELPCKLLAVGDFSGGSCLEPLHQRKRHKITRNNIDSVVQAVDPRLTLTVPNKFQQHEGELVVDLKFEKLKDFHPDELIMQVPALRKLLAMRNVLKDFKTNLMDSKSLQSALQNIIIDPEKIKSFKKELSQLSHNGENQHES